ncbi:hypothetical protein [Terricaulis sp.]|uniref:hypothetical protein n=1 Tax=Terricaulis sp. TaxID=2768686 RepID=UPI003784D0A8
MKKLIFLAVTALAACSQPTTTATTAGDPIPADVAPYIARARAPADAEMEALTGGVLTIVDGCVRITQPTGNPGRLVVWPAETTVDASTGAVRIRNGRTGVEVSVSETVQLSGGESAEIDQSQLAEAIPAACPGPYWIAGSQWMVQHQ